MHSCFSCQIVRHQAASVLGRLSHKNHRVNKIADISIGTLMMAVQAVKKEVLRLEALLQAGNLDDDADVQDLLFSYEQTADELKALYMEKQKFATNYPDYDSL